MTVEAKPYTKIYRVTYDPTAGENAHKFTLPWV